MMVTGQSNIRVEGIYHLFSRPLRSYRRAPAFKLQLACQPEWQIAELPFKFTSRTDSPSARESDPRSARPEPPGGSATEHNKPLLRVLLVHDLES